MRSNRGDQDQDYDQEQEDLQIRGGEGVALTNVAGFVAFAEPADTLLGGAVSEGFWHDTAPGTALESIVADRSSGSQRFIDVAGFDDVFGAIGIMRPDTGEEVSLKLEANGEAVEFGLADAAARRLHFVGDAEQVLHVMSDLVRDDVGLGEIAGRAKAVAQFPIKAEIDVNAAILRAIERTGGAAGKSATGLGLIREEDEPRLLVRTTHFSKDVVPNILGIGQDNGDEFRGFVAWGVAVDRSRLRLRLRLLLRLDQRLRVAAEQEVGDNKNHSAQPANRDLPTAAGPADVLHIFAFPSSLPEHRAIKWSLG